MKSMDAKVAIVLAALQIAVLAIIAAFLHMQIGAGPMVCSLLLIPGAILMFREIRALNRVTVRVRSQRQR